MREHLGEEFSGTVTAVTTFGIFVTLDAMYVEGLVHITELGGDYFKFDEMRQELRGERSGIRYAIGLRLRVQVSRVDLDGRRIDFRLVQEGGETLPARSSGKRDARGQRGARDARGARDERGAREERGRRDEFAGQRQERDARDGLEPGGEALAGRKPRGGRDMPSLPPPSPIEGLKASVRKAASGPKPPGGKPKRKPRR